MSSLWGEGGVCYRDSLGARDRTASTREGALPRIDGPPRVRKSDGDWPASVELNGFGSESIVDFS
jgi:hypothetical protein